MAMAFLAVAGVTKSWKEAKGQDDNRHLKTRDIIQFINQHFEENKSPGSYDDIRRKDLNLLVLSDLVLNSANNPSASTNDPTRGYTLQSGIRNLVRFYNSDQWEIKLKLFLKNKPSLAEILKHKQNRPKIPIQIAVDVRLEFSQGEHNQLQREVVEEFLPRFGFGARVLYIGDTSNKMLFQLSAELMALNISKLSHDQLPDIIAYQQERNWLYLIEAVFSSGPMSEERVYELRKLFSNCNADLIFITAFISKADFRKYLSEIAWETEVWTADNPDHLIHFNGDKFLGPYLSRQK